MCDDKNNQEAHMKYVFGEKGYIKSYALVSINYKDEQTLVREISDKGGDYLTLNDGTGAGFLFSMSAKQIIETISSYDYIGAFIYGENRADSTPYFYKRNEKGCYESFSLDPVVSSFDIEIIAPACSDIWKDLTINDYFQESLFAYLEDHESVEDE